MTFPEIVESKDLLWGRTCAVDNVRARRKGVLGKLYEIQISPERGSSQFLKFPSYFGMEYVRPWNMGKKLLETWYNQPFWNKLFLINRGVRWIMAKVGCGVSRLDSRSWILPKVQVPQLTHPVLKGLSLIVFSPASILAWIFPGEMIGFTLW